MQIKQRALSAIKERLFYDGRQGSDKHDKFREANHLMQAKKGLVECLPKEVQMRMAEDVIHSIDAHHLQSIAKTPERWMDQYRQSLKPKAKVIELKLLEDSILKDLQAMGQESYNRGELTIGRPSEPASNAANHQGGGSSKLRLKEQLEHRARRNPLTGYLDKYNAYPDDPSKKEGDFSNGYPCLMFWPKLQVLVPIKSMSICPENAKLLKVEYYRPKDKTAAATDVIKQNMSSALMRMMTKKIDKDELSGSCVQFHPSLTVEYYNLMELHMEGLKAQETETEIGFPRDEGIIYGDRAEKHLQNRKMCGDWRAGNGNVLWLVHSALNFERIFVFVKDDHMLAAVAAAVKGTPFERDSTPTTPGRLQEQEDGAYSDRALLRVDRHPYEMPVKPRSIPCSQKNRVREAGAAALGDTARAVEVLIQKLFESQPDYRGHVASVMRPAQPPSPTGIVERIRADKHHHHFQEEDEEEEPHTHHHLDKAQVDLSDLHLT
jgi:hypothetical protein